MREPLQPKTMYQHEQTNHLSDGLPGTLFYEHIDEDIILGNLEVAEELAANPELEPMTVFQIDDGWQKVWGDWTANEGFPRGMETLATEIKEAGFDAGLWLAPFYVSTTGRTLHRTNRLVGQRHQWRPHSYSPIWVLASMRLST